MITTKTDAIARVLEIVADIECVHKTDTDGAGFYDVTQRPDGHSVNRFLGSDAELVAYQNGIHNLQTSSHGAGKFSVQAFGPDSKLLADVDWNVPYKVGPFPGE